MRRPRSWNSTSVSRRQFHNHWSSLEPSIQVCAKKTAWTTIRQLLVRAPSLFGDPATDILGEVFAASPQVTSHFGFHSSSCRKVIRSSMYGAYSALPRIWRSNGLEFCFMARYQSWLAVFAARCIVRSLALGRDWPLMWYVVCLRAARGLWNGATPLLLVAPHVSPDVARACWPNCASATLRSGRWVSRAHALPLIVQGTTS